MRAWIVAALVAAGCGELQGPTYGEYCAQMFGAWCARADQCGVLESSECEARLLADCCSSETCPAEAHVTQPELESCVVAIDALTCPAVDGGLLPRVCAGEAAAR